ncbi:MAG: alpha/beta hydrolase [Bryobacteraceae bacterium]
MRQRTRSYTVIARCCQGVNVCRAGLVLRSHSPQSCLHTQCSGTSQTASSTIRCAIHRARGNCRPRPARKTAGLQPRTNAGSAFLVVDYRGYGKSQGEPSERGLYQDADAAYAELLHLGYGPERIVIQGESLGTAIAVDLAMRKQCAGVILESPLMSAGRMAGKVLPFSVH